MIKDLVRDNNCSFDQFLFNYNACHKLDVSRKVVKAYDHKNGSMVAIKIIRNKKRFHHQALVEVKLLDLLRRKVSSSANYYLVHFSIND